MDGSPASGTGPRPPVPLHVAGVRSLCPDASFLRHRLLYLAALLPGDASGQPSVGGHVAEDVKIHKKD